MSDGFSEFAAGQCFVSWKAWQLVSSQGNFLRSFSLKFPRKETTKQIYNKTALLRFTNNDNEHKWRIFDESVQFLISTDPDVMCDDARLFKFLYTSGFALGNVKSLKLFKTICCKLLPSQWMKRKLACYSQCVTAVSSLTDTAVPKYNLFSF